ncbi:MAG TPA: hypothetical protein VM012_14605 [Flavitalea sp.]|nr:hypothetical protein [Flavitalea sp.]
MKKVLLSVWAVCIVVVINGQQIDLSHLSMPSSPGWVLADKAPASIEKPSTPRAFGVSLLNLLQGSAVEATPYWFASKPNLEYMDWVKKKSLFIETFNISAATFKTDTNSLLSFGVKSQVIRIYSSDQIRRLEKQEAKIIEALTTPDAAGNIDVIRVEKENKKLETIQQRGFFAIDIATALVGTSGNNTFKNLQSNRAGVWTTVRWSPAQSQLDFVALARYAWTLNNINSTDSTFLDYGLSLNYEVANFNLSVEYINRHNLKVGEIYHRFTVNGIYQISKNLAITGSVGKNYDNEKNLFTVFGMNIAIASQQVKSTAPDEE